MRHTGFLALAGGHGYSLGLKADGSIVAWGSNYYGQCDVPEPNTNFVAVAAGANASLALIAGWPTFSERGDAIPRRAGACPRFKGLV